MIKATNLDAVVRDLADVEQARHASDLHEGWVAYVGVMSRRVREVPRG